MRWPHINTLTPDWQVTILKEWLAKEKLTHELKTLPGVGDRRSHAVLSLRKTVTNPDDSVVTNYDLWVQFLCRLWTDPDALLDEKFRHENRWGGKPTIQLFTKPVLIEIRTWSSSWLDENDLELVCSALYS
jgi:hypothetical protein